MPLYPRRQPAVAVAESGREPESEAEADRHRLAVQDRAIAALRLDRMAESMAEIEQRPSVAWPLLPLVVAHYGGF